MRVVAIAFAAMGAFCASSARAEPLTNSEIGLTALGKHQYTAAIAAFTKALKSDDLIDGLKVFAYDGRAKAHLGLHQNKLALADYQQALAIDPSDTDAQSGVASLGGSGPAPTPVRVAAVPRNAWGPLAQLVGHTWLESGGAVGRWCEYTWEKPGEIIAFHGMDQAGNAFAGSYQLDRATGHVSGLTVVKGQSVSTELSEVTETSLAEDSVQQGVQVRQSLVFQHAGLFEQTASALVNGAWKQVAKTKLVQASPDVIATLNWKQAPQESGFMKVLRGMGGAFLDGAKAGFTDGVHDGVAAKTRHEIAPKQYPNAPQ